MAQQIMSPSELYSFAFQHPEPKHYTMIPNIIDHLTYKKKNKKGIEVSTRLSVFAKELYRIIRMVASDHGVCWCCTKTLAEKVGCSVGTICNAKKELLMPMEQLDGNPLLTEIRKMISKKENDKVTSKRELCTYTIVDIWPWNNAFMSTLKFHIKTETDSPHESVPPTDSPHESVSQGTDSPHEPNKIYNNKISLFKEQQPTANADPVVLSNHKEGLLPSDQEKIYSHLIENGCKESVAKRISKSTSCKDYKNASEYMRQQMRKNKAKGKEVPNLWGYFQTILTNRYWEKK